MRFWSVARLLILVALGFAGSTCGRSEGDLTVESFLQSGRAGVRLNEPLVMRFNRPVDPTTVNGSSIRITDEHGGPARGAWSVSGSEAIFQPDHPCSPSLEGAGLRCGAEYTVVAAGFPFHGAVRSPSGVPLAHRAAFRFETIRPSALAEPFAAFYDATPGQGPKLVAVNGILRDAVPPTGVVLSPAAEIELEFSEPLHPAGVLDGASRIHVVEDVSDPAPGIRTIALICTLAPAAGNRTILARPEHPLSDGDRFDLRRESLKFTDFAGNGIQDSEFNFIRFVCRDSP